MLGVEATSETLTDGLSKNHAAQKAIMQEIRERLTALAKVPGEKPWRQTAHSGVGGPAGPLPSHLRHPNTGSDQVLLSVDSLVFVVATDTDQLSYSINAVYGEKVRCRHLLAAVFSAAGKTAPVPGFDAVYSGQI